MHQERPLKKTPNGWFLNYRFNRPELEHTLRQGVVRFPTITVKSGCEVIKLRNLADGVEVTYADDRGAQVLHAANVVGCDGGRSFTRSAMESEFEDLGFHEEWLIIDLLLHERESDPDRYTYHYCGYARMGSKVFVGSIRKRLEFRLNGDDDRATVQDPDVVWSILEPWITSAEATLERTALYTFHSTIGDKWR